MQFLSRQRDEDTELWWTSALSRSDLPLVVRELLHDRRVMVTDDEAAEALAWARALPGWDDERPALFVADE